MIPPDDSGSGRRRKRFRTRLAAALGTAAVRVLGSTWRVRHEGAEGFSALRERGEPSIVLFWHSDILALAWAHRGSGIAPLISQHADGDAMTRIAERLGFRPLRGSSSRGALRALLEAARLLEEGVTVAFTPDGPRGPRRSFAPGALVVAQRTGRPVFAMVASASRSWRLRSWDQHLVPKPFATITVRYSGPHAVRAGSAREAELEVPRFEAIMRETGDTR